MKMLVATEDKEVGNSATDIKAQTEQMSFHFILICSRSQFKDCQRRP